MRDDEGAPEACFRGAFRCMTCPFGEDEWYGTFPLVVSKNEGPALPGPDSLIKLMWRRYSLCQ
jgi:hypothetical protein